MGMLSCCCFDELPMAALDLLTLSTSKSGRTRRDKAGVPAALRAQGHGSNPYLSALYCQNLLTVRLLCSTCKQPRTEAVIFR